MYLLIVDTTQIQAYVFGSNRLSENVGASHLVSQATGQWAREVIAAEWTGAHNLEGTRLNEALHIEDGQLAVEVIYTGGGNTVAVLQDEATAQTFIKRLSRRVLCAAPGLQLVIEGQPFDWGNAALAQILDDVFIKLSKRKAARPLSAPLLGLGVTASCQSTGLPATGMAPPVGDTPDYPASAEILAKLAAADEAHDGLRAEFAELLGESYDFPREFDKLGRSQGDQSYLAVVHADGDGMGRRIQQIGKAHQQADEQRTLKQVNRDYVNALRAFSQAVTEAASKALRTTLKRLTEQVSKNPDGELVHPAEAEGQTTVAPIQLKWEDNKYLLPFRPLVFGGDDLTFVCDGRLGLALMTSYQREFAKETAARLGSGGALTASAGSAIVKVHYPFARAYRLAEELCHSAKQYRRSIPNCQDACLDWHFAFSGLAGDLAEIRRREYELEKPSSDKKNRLHLRPVTLQEGNGLHSFRAWPVIRHLVTACQSGELAGKRGKAKTLREVLREGPEEVGSFITLLHKQQLPSLGAGQPGAFTKDGWFGWASNDDGYCGYFDALELADWWMPLEEET